jgi:hypothetical protein
MLGLLAWSRTVFSPSGAVGRGSLTTYALTNQTTCSPSHSHQTGPLNNNNLKAYKTSFSELNIEKE